MHAILDKWIANGLIRPSDKPPTEENKKKKKNERYGNMYITLPLMLNHVEAISHQDKGQDSGIGKTTIGCVKEPPFAAYER
jgi:hypothetical protein